MMHCKLKSRRLSAIAFFAVGYKFQSSNDVWIEGNGEHNSNPAENLTNIPTDFSLAAEVIAWTCCKGSLFTFFSLI
jgi:hypothetical protein